MPAYLLVLEIRPVKAGKTYPMLPLHCTLVHWFWLDLPADELVQHIRAVGKHSPLVRITAGEEAVFTGHTKQGDIPVTVNKVKVTADLRTLHRVVCDELDILGARYTAPQYVRGGYSPHITHQGQDSLPAGSTHVSSALYVVQADAPEYGNDRYICARITLGD